MSSRRHPAWLALLLLVPAPSIGAALAMSVEATRGTLLGQGAYACSKLWLVALPAVWWVWIDGERPSFSPARKGGFGVAIALGLLLSAVIYAAYLLLAPLLVDPAQVRASALRVGIGTPARFLLFALYLTAVNSLLEEYVWRWFVLRKCEELLPGTSGWVPVSLSAFFFTLHHVIALSAQFPAAATALASLGVFVAGLTWSWCYHRYRSIWPGYVSHLIADFTLLWIGWRLIFSG